MTMPLVAPRPEVAVADLADHLSKLQDTLQEQLETLPPTTLDDVSAAHRGSVEQHLEEVQVALRRLSEGRYGFCMSCSDPIAAGRLEVRPWATRCTRCAARPRW